MENDEKEFESRIFDKENSTNEIDMSKSLNEKKNLNSNYESQNDAFNYQTLKNNSYNKVSGLINNDDLAGNNLTVFKNDIIPGINRSYRIISRIGIGTFGQVYKCVSDGDVYAIKIIKNRKIYMEHGIFESQILKKLSNNRYIVQIIDTLIHKGHFCIVMELLGSNLYEMLKIKKFSGLSHLGMRIVCSQILDALCDLYAHGIVHCDLKPENIVIADPQSLKIKIIDFGSSFFGQKDAYFYIQSRFYRAPEVILGMPYDNSIDMWSFGCLVYEIFVGYPLFPGKDNYDQMGRICKMLGNPPNFMIENANNSHFYNKRIFSPEAPDLASIKQKIVAQPCNIHENMLFYKFLLNILQINPLTRPTPFQVRKDPYLNNEIVMQNAWTQQSLSEVQNDISTNVHGNKSLTTLKNQPLSSLRNEPIRNQPNPIPRRSLRRESVFDLNDFSQSFKNAGERRKKSQFDFKKKNDN
ncbi:putative dual specificity protein kinase YAK1 like protein [Dictyocoela muelleri]|nr:putative dual specificity protein kinase YAK1 like protein [Dictyocoela muelleri]